MPNPNTKDLKKFGFMWSGIFLIIGIFKGGSILITLGILSLLFILISLFLPDTLKYLYIFWIKFGSIIGHINSKIILFVLFFIIFTPIAFVLKIFGKDFLDKRINKNINSYWTKKEVFESSMDNQF